MVQKLRSKSRLGVYLLESRLQPNDLFGLGLSMLTGANPTGVEQPPVMVREEPVQDVAVITEVTPELVSELPDVWQTAETVQAPAFDAGAIENVFGAVNAQPTEFSLESPAPAPAPLPVLPTAPAPQYSGAGLMATYNPGTRGGGDMPVPVGQQDYTSLLLGLVTGSKQSQESVRGGLTTITDGPVSVTVNGFGFANAFSVSGPDQLFNSGYFMSTANGAPLEISAANCTLSTPLTMISPTRYDSIATCSGTSVYFIQEVYGSFGLWMTAGFIFGPVRCVYGYTDYDVFGDPNDLGQYQSFPPQSDFIVKDAAQPDKFLFTDYDLGLGTPLAHWQQAAWPTLLNQIIGYTTCSNLTDGPAAFGPGDWTGALQYSYPAGTVEAIFVNFHWRNDAA